MPILEDETCGPSTLEAPQAPTVPACSHCGHPMKTVEVTVCHKCGYYAKLDTFMDIDPTWERDDDEDQDEEKRISHVEVWMNLIPVWAWGLILCVLAVVVESVAVSQMTLQGSVGRAYWSMGQLLLGFFGVFGVHLFVFVTYIMHEEGAGLLDIVLRPFACWSPTLKRLPATFGRVAIFAGGLTAVLCSFLVLGGFNYESLLDWGYKKQASSNLMGAIIDQAKKAPGGNEDDMEGAINAFAGGAGAEEFADAKEEPPKPRVTVECVIIGYKTPSDNPKMFSSLVVAGAVDGQLKVIGSVSAGIPAELRDKLNQKLREIPRSKPFVETITRAHWVEPELTCRVTCVQQTKAGLLVEPRFDDMLAKLDSK